MQTTKKPSAWKKLDTSGSPVAERTLIPINEVLEQSPFQTEADTEPFRALLRQFLVLWDRAVDAGQTLPLTSQTLSVWIGTDIEDVNGWLFNTAGIQELRGLRDFAAIGLDGHKTLMQYQAQITKAFELEVASRGRHAQSMPAWKILDACGRIYKYKRGTAEHIRAAYDLSRASALLH